MHIWAPFDAFFDLLVFEQSPSFCEPFPAIFATCLEVQLAGPIRFSLAILNNISYLLLLSILCRHCFLRSRAVIVLSIIASYRQV